MRIKAVTFATDNFRERAEKLMESAKKIGISDFKILTKEQLESDFYIKNKEILDKTRGAGLWLWKPYLILKELKKLGTDEKLFYLDAGRNSYWDLWDTALYVFNHPVLTNQGFLLGPSIDHLGPIEMWTKRETLECMGVGEMQIKNIKMIQMNWSVWTNCEKSIRFLESWLYYCTNKICIMDENITETKNYKNFIDHRHDQSIASILAHKQKIEILDYSRTLAMRLIASRPGSFYSNSILKNPSNVYYLEKGLVVLLFYKNILKKHSAYNNIKRK